MAKVLIVEKASPERDGLSLVLEFAGHQCSPVDSMQAAREALKAEKFELVLADAACALDGVPNLIHQLKALSPGTAVLALGEEADATSTEEAITNPYSPVQNLATNLAAIQRKDAFLVLLPEPDSLQRLSGLPTTSGMLNRLAVLYHSQKKYKTAERLYRRALAACESQPGSRQGTEVATILNNLARLYHDQDRFEDAEPLYRRSLAIVEKELGQHSSKTLTRVRNLADLYHSQGRTDEAKALTERLSAHKPSGKR